MTALNTTVGTVQAMALELHGDADPRQLQDATRRVRESDEKGVAEIVAFGRILEPLLVRRSNSRLEVIDGHMRRDAAIRAGLPTVPVVYRDCDERDALILAVSSNCRHGRNLSEEEKVNRFCSLSPKTQVSATSGSARSSI